MKHHIVVVVPTLVSALCLVSGLAFARPAAPVAPAPEPPPAAAPASESPGDDADFCPSLGVYLASAGARFSSITGDVMFDDFAWYTTTPIATATSCLVSKSFMGAGLSAVCHFSSGTTDGAAAQEALIAKVRACESGWKRVDSVDSAGVRVATLTMDQRPQILVETDPVKDGAVVQHLRVGETSATPATAPPVASAAPAPTSSPSADASLLDIDFSAFNWGASPSRTAPAPTPVTPTAPTPREPVTVERERPSPSRSERHEAASSDELVSDQEVQDEIDRITWKQGYKDQIRMDDVPKAPDLCTGLKAYVAAAPDDFKAVRQVQHWDTGYLGVDEWDANPALPGFYTCKIDAWPVAWVACENGSYSASTDAADYAAFLKQLAACLPGYASLPGVSIVTDQTQDSGRTTQTLKISRK